jgi:hypothetical protein
MPGANMKVISLLPLAIALAGTVAVGQDSVKRAPITNGGLAIIPSLTEACPIRLEVSYGAVTAQKRTDYDAHPGDRMPLTGPVQKIHLAVTNPSAREIVRMELTVHGYSEKWRTFTLASAAPDLTKKITATRDIEGNGHASSDISLSNFTAISSVDLDSLTYADGFSWEAVTHGVCSVAPNSLMLVSTAR